MVGKFLALVGAVAMSSAMPAQAEDSTDAAKKTDPNEVVCEKIEVLGSRLAVKRVCKTRSEWAEQRRLDRQGIDKAQTQRGSCDKC